jgi:DNA topoisomerase-1
MAKKPSRPKRSGSKARATPGPKGDRVPAGDYQLVIVESPAKAKTIEKYLGSGYVVKASIGHIRDLPSRAPKGSKQPVPGVDLDHDFAPTYEIDDDKAKTVAELKRLAKGAGEIWFATDLDREGEAIAWHLTQVLGVDPGRAKRVTFDAITKSEVQRAFAEPRAINMPRVEAQQARRIVDPGLRRGPVGEPPRRMDRLHGPPRRTRPPAFRARPHGLAGRAPRPRLRHGGSRRKVVQDRG